MLLNSVVMATNLQVNKCPKVYLLNYFFLEGIININCSLSKFVVILRTANFLAKKGQFHNTLI